MTCPEMFFLLKFVQFKKKKLLLLCNCNVLLSWLPVCYEI